MDPQLSRRAGRAMSTDVFLSLGRERTEEFIEAVSSVQDFDHLNKEMQGLIVAAERTYVKDGSKS